MLNFQFFRNSFLLSILIFTDTLALKNLVLYDHPMNIDLYGHPSSVYRTLCLYCAPVSLGAMKMYTSSVEGNYVVSNLCVVLSSFG